ncbi:hypothetical protein AXG93_590s1130 [Marchantia polymorpha subsp. ruderalis]|uniref:Uncharacterized protein n=1 Tax=Marchantia polymorpha subsp. ruderalis TaxID=1480154 RepID=A0A176VUN9_MARPO|nr:hypothetical protein AXG93_590s1130 [Marchantia polymorpha subsp. ruderalis]
MGAGALAEDRWDHVEGTSTRSAESLISAPRRKPGESVEMMRRAQREAGDRAAITSRSAQSRDRVLECLPAIIRCTVFRLPSATSTYCPGLAEQREELQISVGQTSTNLNIDNVAFGPIPSSHFGSVALTLMCCPLLLHFDSFVLALFPLDCLAIVSFIPVATVCDPSGSKRDGSWGSRRGPLGSCRRHVHSKRGVSDLGSSAEARGVWGDDVEGTA